MLSVLESASRRIDEFCEPAATGLRPAHRDQQVRRRRPADCLWLDDDLATTTTVTVRSSATTPDGLHRRHRLLPPAGDGAYGDAPYRRILLHDVGDHAAFGSGLPHHRRRRDGGATRPSPATLTITTAEALDATEQVIDVSALTGISPGMTLLIESEQVYVSATTDSTSPTRSPSTVASTAPRPPSTTRARRSAGSSTTPPSWTPATAWRSDAGGPATPGPTAWTAAARSA